MRKHRNVIHRSQKMNVPILVGATAIIVVIMYKS